MTTPLAQGGLANSSGNTLEQTIVATLVSKGFPVELYRQWVKDPAAYPPDILLRNVPYATIYGHRGNTEFLLLSKRYNLTTRIECKWQQSAGSVDEKFPYLYLNCVEQMPEDQIIIVVDGGGAKAGAVEWLQRACAERLYLDDDTPKSITMMNLVGFMSWANRVFR
jgi:hypothetical protein